MKKIRINYLESLNFSIKNKLDDFIKNETLLVSGSEGLFYNELNYLTFDELEYLVNNLNKECEMYADLLEIYNQSKIILNKFFKCVEIDNFEELSEYEENRILILQGYKTYLDIFPGIFEKNDEKFVFFGEELRIKNKFEEYLILKRINLKVSTVANNTFKYTAIFSSVKLYLMKKNNLVIDEKIIKNIEQKALLNSFDLQKIFLRPSKGDINTTHVLYLNETDDMNKFVFYHKIINSSEEQELINKLFENSELDKLNTNALASIYLISGGNSFLLNKKIKINTINNEALDEIRKLLIERHSTSSQMSNSYDETNEDINGSKRKVIKFPKRVE